MKGSNRRRGGEVACGSFSRAKILNDGDTRTERLKTMYMAGLGLDIRGAG
jgi:hypothetical protein